MTPTRFPAEWEPQSAVLLAWPHQDTDWAERLADVEETYVALVAAIARFGRAIVCVADADLQTYAEARLRSTAPKPCDTKNRAQAVTAARGKRSTSPPASESSVTTSTDETVLIGTVRAT